MLGIWDALRAAAEADINLAQAIIDSAGVIIQNPDMTVGYDEGGPILLFLRPNKCCYVPFAFIGRNKTGALQIF